MHILCMLIQFCLVQTISSNHHTWISFYENYFYISYVLIICQHSIYCSFSSFSMSSIIFFKMFNSFFIDEQLEIVIFETTFWTFQRRKCLNGFNLPCIIVSNRNNVKYRGCHKNCTGNVYHKHFPPHDFRSSFWVEQDLTSFINIL